MLQSSDRESIKCYAILKPFTKAITINQCLSYNKESKTLSIGNTGSIILDGFISDTKEQSAFLQEISNQIGKDNLNGINTALISFGGLFTGKTSTLIGNLSNIRNNESNSIIPKYIEIITNINSINALKVSTFIKLSCYEFDLKTPACDLISNQLINAKNNILKEEKYSYPITSLDQLQKHLLKIKGNHNKDMSIIYIIKTTNCFQDEKNDCYNSSSVALFVDLNMNYDHRNYNGIDMKKFSESILMNNGYIENGDPNKIAKVLRKCFEGNYKTIMLSHVSNSVLDYNDTLSTINILRLGQYNKTEIRRNYHKNITHEQYDKIQKCIKHLKCQSRMKLIDPSSSGKRRSTSDIQENESNKVNINEEMDYFLFLKSQFEAKLNKFTKGVKEFLSHNSSSNSNSNKENILIKDYYYTRIVSLLKSVKDINNSKNQVSSHLPDLISSFHPNSHYINLSSTNSLSLIIAYENEIDSLKETITKYSHHNYNLQCQLNYIKQPPLNHLQSDINKDIIKVNLQDVIDYSLSALISLHHNFIQIKETNSNSNKILLNAYTALNTLTNQYQQSEAKVQQLNDSLDFLKKVIIDQSNQFNQFHTMINDEFKEIEDERAMINNQLKDLSLLYQSTIQSYETYFIEYGNSDNNPNGQSKRLFIELAKKTLELEENETIINALSRDNRKLKCDEIKIKAETLRLKRINEGNCDIQIMKKNQAEIKKMKTHNVSLNEMIESQCETIKKSNDIISTLQEQLNQQYKLFEELIENILFKPDIESCSIEHCNNELNKIKESLSVLHEEKVILLKDQQCKNNKIDKDSYSIIFEERKGDEYYKSQYDINYKKMTINIRIGLLKILQEKIEGLIIPYEQLYSIDKLKKHIKELNSFSCQIYSNDHYNIASNSLIVKFTKDRTINNKITKELMLLISQVEMLSKHIHSNCPFIDKRNTVKRLKTKRKINKQKTEGDNGNCSLLLAIQEDNKIIHQEIARIKSSQYKMQENINKTYDYYHKF